MKFRKKPVVIEAEKVHPSGIPEEPPLYWLQRWADNLPILFRKDGTEIPPPDFEKWCFAPDHIIVPTLEGDRRANIGDYLIRGIAGEFYPCKPDIFAATYEPADAAMTRAGKEGE